MAATLEPFLSGLALGASLIIAIGAQNAFVLRRGIARDHVGATVAVCVLCDWLLIAAGALGFGVLVTAYPAVTGFAAWGGGVFLLYYGARSFHAAAHPGALSAEQDGSRATQSTMRATIAATLAVSLLNPHVYLDTVVLLGGVAAQHQGASKFAFVAGAWVSSLAWFSGLGFGARLLAPVFSRPRTWRLLDFGIGVVMWAIAYGLIAGQLG